jgi:hypothetical protein
MEKSHHAIAATDCRSAPAREYSGLPEKLSRTMGLITCKTASVCKRPSELRDAEHATWVDGPQYEKLDGETPTVLRK